jgi:hypothetical protein
MRFCRIDLLQTNYQVLPDAVLLDGKAKLANCGALIEIYEQYCRYKKFESVMPLFLSDITGNGVIAYYDDSRIVAFSILKYSSVDSVESVQFAWDYANPELRLGIRSIEHECAYFKSIGMSYLYLGQVAEYKKQFDGYEELTNPYV